MRADTYLEEDEIDLRGIIQTLLKSFWWILGATVVFALAGFLGSKLVMNKTYVATSYVMIVKPSTIINFEGGIESSPQLPDAKSMTDLTLSDDLVNSVLQDPKVTAIYEEQITHSDVKAQLKSSLVGGNQLRLEVTDTEAEHAAIIANVWARKVASRFNSLFGSGSTEFEQTESQVEQSRLEWDSAEQALLGYLEKNDVDALRISLEQLRLALGELIAKAEAIDTLIINAQTFQAQLDAGSSNDPLAVESALSLISLNQQAVGQVENLQIQVSVETNPDQTITVGDAMDSLADLISALEQKKAELGKSVTDKSARLTELSTKYETVRYEVDQLTLQRDLSRQAYEALSTHAVEVQILSASNNQVAKVAGEALPPVSPSGPKTMMNTAIAGALGLVMAVILVLVWDWWKSSK